jgi:hypothetical protein
LGVLYICLVVLLAVAMGLDPSARQPAFVFPVIFFGFVVAAHLATAKGARQAKPWARTASIIISLFMLLGFPIGTLIGVYLLANTWKPWPPSPAPAVPA